MSSLIVSPQVPVLAMPAVDPSRHRIEMTFAEGATIREIVDQVWRLHLPGATAEQLGRAVRVTINGHLVDPRHWHRVRPKAGWLVVVRVAPGDALKSILGILVTIAASFVAPYLAPLLTGVFGMTQATALSIATAGLAFAGNMLLNVFIPAPKPADQAKTSPTYGFSGYRNQENLDGPFPDVLGEHRFAPIFLCSPYTEVVGDDLYSIGYAVFGYGPMRISNVRIGETPISEFNDVQYEIREGYPDDAPISLVSQQIVEEPLSVELVWDAKDDEGEKTIRRTQQDVTGISIDFTAQGGLCKFDDDGNRQFWLIVIKVEYRLVGDADWTLQQDLEIRAAKQKALRRTLYWDVPVRGTYEVRLRRTTRNRNDAKIVDTLYWTALRSFRPEPPLNWDLTAKPLARIAWRIRMSRQINGMIDTVSADVTKVCPDWDAATQTWITRPTSNPASLMRHVLQGPATAKPEPDAKINLAQLRDWHEFCTVKGLRYARVHDYEATRNDVLAAVCGAGRATWSDDGSQFGVVIDRPRDMPVNMLGARTVKGLRWSRSYIDLPEAFKVPFQDRTDQYREAERLVLRPGFTGTPLLTEELRLEGVTDPAQAWKAATRRFLELMHRADSWTCSQDLEVMQVARGDMALLNHDILDEIHTTGRVVRVIGSMVELNEPVTMEAGTDYAIRFRGPDFSTALYRIATRPGRHAGVRLTSYEGEGAAPAVATGHAFAFGRHGQETEEVLVNRVERSDRDLSGTLHLVPHAPQIDTLLDAMAVPAWNGRVGSEAPPVLTPPQPPVFTVTSGREALDDDDVTGNVTVVAVELYPGPGTTVEVELYHLRHRLQGAADWTVVDVSAGSPVKKLTGYVADNVVELQAQAVSRAAVDSAWSAVVTHTVLSAKVVAPPVTAFEVATVAGNLRRYTWTIADTESTGTIYVEIRYAAGTVAAWEDLAPLHSGQLSVSPWDSASPVENGTYTFGIRSFDAKGNSAATAALITRTLSGEAVPGAADIAPPVVSGASVQLQMLAPNSASFAAGRFWRAAAGAGFLAAVDITGPIFGAPNATLSYVDAPGAGTWDYWATAENSSAAASSPDGPETATVT